MTVKVTRRRRCFDWQAGRVKKRPSPHSLLLFLTPTQPLPRVICPLFAALSGCLSHHPLWLSGHICLQGCAEITSHLAPQPVL